MFLRCTQSFVAKTYDILPVGMLIYRAWSSGGRNTNKGRQVYNNSRSYTPGLWSAFWGLFCSGFTLEQVLVFPLLPLTCRTLLSEAGLLCLRSSWFGLGKMAPVSWVQVLLSVCSSQEDSFCSDKGILINNPVHPPQKTGPNSSLLSLFYGPTYLDWINTLIFIQ